MGDRSLSGAGGESSFLRGKEGRKEEEGRWRSSCRAFGSLGADGFLYPVAVFADLSVDSWMLSRAAGVNAP